MNTIKIDIPKIKYPTFLFSMEIWKMRAFKNVAF